MHGTPEPSSWLLRWQQFVPAGARVLDVACGGGRHVRWLAARGCQVTGIDRDAQVLAPLRPLAETIVADLEDGPWPCVGRQFDAVLVTNYLWRPLFAPLMAALAPGAALIYETFASGNETVGRPARPEFLLRHGELLSACAGLHVVAYEEGFLREPQRFVQRIVALRHQPSASEPARFELAAPG